MTGLRRGQPVVIGALLLVLPSAVSAQGQGSDVQTLRQEIQQLRNELQAIQKQYGDRLTALESKLGAAPGAVAGVPAAPAAVQAEQGPTAQVPPGAEAGGPSGALPVYGAAAAASKIFNPDIAVIGNFLGAA